jgi:two-component system CheB/CheR fusion protein
MARDGLAGPLRTLFEAAAKSGLPARARGVRVGSEVVDLQVIPLRHLKEPHYVVLFETALPPGGGEPALKPEAAAAPAAPSPAGTGGATLDALAERLRDTEHELGEARSYALAIQQQADAFSEEQQATNEEAQSANEELQSINEELQTSKEELESTNEELSTVNEELGARIAELARVNADLNNLYLNVNTAILVVNRDLVIRRFTPLAAPAFNLLATDVGRPLGGIRQTLYETAPGPQANPNETLLDIEHLARDVIAGSRSVEREVRNRDGHWYSLRIRPFVSLDNAVDGAVLALVDIDELKRSNQAATAALAYAEATGDAMLDAYLVLGSDLRVRTANEAFYRVFQVDPAETEGKLVYELGHGQWGIDTLRMLLEDILPRNSHFEEFEVTHRFDNIGERTMLLSGRKVDALSGPDLILLTIEDVTESRRAAAASRASEERFRLLAETMPEKILTADESGAVGYCNPQWTAFSGLSADQLAGWGWTNLIHPEDSPESLAAWRKSLQTGSPCVLEHRLRRRDGEYRWHVSRATASVRHGEPTTWIWASTDINEVKESDQRKDEFLATLAHELRSPLAPIGNALQILQRVGTNNAAKPALEVLQRQFSHAVRLMDDLLDVSRISRGKVALHRVRMDLGLAVQQAVELARVHTERRSQQLDVELPAAPLYLDADLARLVQIIGNLLNNASKFTDAGGHIRLDAAREGDEAVIRIRDDGIGLARSQLSRIFEMFVQVDTSLERSHGGLGIGLTLVKKLVEMHGGRVEARSEGLGTGTEFVIRLPAASAGPAAESASAAEPVPSVPSPRRVLVVDDNLDSAESLSELLRLEGHDVHLAHDGLAAIAAAAAIQPDVVLLDIGLPRLNGYEAGRRIRQQAGERPLLMVALTGWGQQEDRARSKGAGFDAHLVKPLDISALRAMFAQRAS